MLLSFSRIKELKGQPGWFFSFVIQMYHAFRFVFDYPYPREKVFLFCYPDKPTPLHALWRVCRVLGIRVRRGTNGTPTIFFADTTRFIGELPTGSEVWINGRCRDISKSTIAKANERAFDRRLAIDPTTHTGPAVEKSEQNAMHDGQIINCPIPQPQPRKAYQRLIDNEVIPGIVEDLRTFVVGSEIILVYAKRRQRSDRFLKTDSEVVVKRSSSVYTEDERAELIDFAQEVGLDFGEMDVLRDTQTNELFVVDVTATSASPSVSLTYNERRQCILQIARAFRSTFLS